MDKEALEKVLELQRKVVEYERFFEDLAFLLTDHTCNVVIPKGDNKTISFCICEIMDMKKRLYEKV